MIGGLETLAVFIGAAVLAAVGAFFRGKRAGRAAEEAKRRKASDALREKYDAIDRDGSGPADAYERLRDRGGR